MTEWYEGRMGGWRLGMGGGVEVIGLIPLLQVPAGISYVSHTLSGGDSI